MKNSAYAAKNIESYIKQTICNVVAVVLLSMAVAPLFGVTAKEICPNVILILADDQGWNYTSVQMDPNNPSSRSDYHETPALEKLASQGMRFSLAYASHPICGPSRHAIQFGMNPARMQITKNFYGPVAKNREFKPREVHPQDAMSATLKRLFPSYRTAHIGKWHIHGYTPAELGYDESDGSTGNADANPGAEGYDPVKDPKRMMELTRRSIDFIERCKQSQQPFFLQLSHYAVHGREDSLRDTLKKYRAKSSGQYHKFPDVAACNENLDSAVGMLLKYLDDAGLASSTYIIYTSDNGGLDTKDRKDINRPLAHGKYYVHEGGIRVPLLIRGPGIPPGSHCGVPVVNMDIMPTVLDWIGSDLKKIPESVEGGSWAPLLKHHGRGDVKRLVDGIVISFPHLIGGKGDIKEEVTAYIRYPYKVIYNWRRKNTELYDIGQDLGEYRDLSQQYPERSDDLRRELFRYLDRYGESVEIKDMDQFLEWEKTKVEKP